MSAFCEILAEHLEAIVEGVVAVLAELPLRVVAALLLLLTVLALTCALAEEDECESFCRIPSLASAPSEAPGRTVR